MNLLLSFPIIFMVPFPFNLPPSLPVPTFSSFPSQFLHKIPSFWGIFLPFFLLSFCVPLPFFLLPLFPCFSFSLIFVQKCPFVSLDAGLKISSLFSLILSLHVQYLLKSFISGFYCLCVCSLFSTCLHPTL